MIQVSVRKEIGGKQMINANKFLMLLGASLVISSVIQAQAPPGPIAPVPGANPTVAGPAPERPAPVKPRPNILGSWKLNKDESDDPRQISDQSSNGGGNRGGGSSGPHVGIGIPGVGIGGGGNGGHRGASQGESDADHEKMQELLRPARLIQFSQKTEYDPEIDMTDDHDRKRIFYTDSRKLQKSKDPGTEEISAHGDNKKLTTEEKGPHGDKLGRTYSLSPEGTQLWEEIRITAGKNGYSRTVRFVYDPVEDPNSAPPAKAQSGKN